MTLILPSAPEACTEALRRAFGAPDAVRLLGPSAAGQMPDALSATAPLQGFSLSADDLAGPRHRVVDLVDSEQFGWAVGRHQGCAHGLRIQF